MTPKDKPANPDAKVAEKVSDGTLAGQIGRIEPLPDSEKPDPTTIAHVQYLDGTPFEA